MTTLNPTSAAPTTAKTDTEKAQALARSGNVLVTALIFCSPLAFMVVGNSKGFALLAWAITLVGWLFAGATWMKLRQIKKTLRERAAA